MGWFTMQGGASHDSQTFYDKYGMDGRIPYTSDYVTIASGYGARTKQRWEPSMDVIEEAIGYYINADVETPAHERKGIELALGYLEAQFSTDLDIADRRSLDWRGGGDPTQMDCVDEAWNATVLLEFLHYHHRNLRWHTILEPMWKQPLFKWLHYGAVLKSNTGYLWVIDGGVRRGGQPPKIFTSTNWYT